MAGTRTRPGGLAPGNRSSLHLRSFEEALREILAMSAAPGKAAPPRADREARDARLEGQEAKEAAGAREGEAARQPPA